VGPLPFLSAPIGAGTVPELPLEWLAAESNTDSHQDGLLASCSSRAPPAISLSIG